MRNCIAMNWRTRTVLTIVSLVKMLCSAVQAAQIPPLQATTGLTIANTVQIECASEAIIVHVFTEGNSKFHGLVYPRGLSKNSSCLHEYQSQDSPITYNLPLRSCNTMPTELEDGGIEYYNTIVVQPHLKLVTNQGRGFHVRCRYQTRDKVVSNDQTQMAMLQSLPLQSVAPVPSCSMKIYSGEPSAHHIAENVKIGDLLTLVISIEKQKEFGLRITDCLVRDGIGWGEQRLINHEGCPVDNEIMGQFSYSEDKTEAKVQFQAHKFPYTQSVYYQCNVSLCSQNTGGCSDTPPLCNEIARRRRDTKDASNANSETGVPATIEVYSGFYVNDADVVPKPDYYDVSKEKAFDDTNAICMSQRSFAIGIAIASLFLLLAIIGAILILLGRRRHKSISTSGSSIYSGPYTNTAYSHSS
ncbi:cuticlin-4 [Phymastichus coffea]|uniref:cuticlin-4 n=1 Tax=Phymastichus coffea TaxID=108790 RepID=UPI00273AAF63|nr:cuticlin-4 [Phymastichus coffea]